MVSDRKTFVFSPSLCSCSLKHFFKQLMLASTFTFAALVSFLKGLLLTYVRAKLSLETQKPSTAPCLFGFISWASGVWFLSFCSQHRQCCQGQCPAWAGLFTSSAGKGMGQRTGPDPLPHRMAWVMTSCDDTLQSSGTNVPDTSRSQWGWSI